MTKKLIFSLLCGLLLFDSAKCQSLASQQDCLSESFELKDTDASFSIDSIPTECKNVSTDVENISNSYKFQPAAAIASTCLIAVAVGGLYLDQAWQWNHMVQDGMGNIRTRKLHFDDYIQYTPILTYVGFGAIGIKSRYDFKRRMAAGLTSYATMAICVNAAKYSFRIKRPDASTRNSFPSGHTAVVFTGAELMRIEYGNIIGAASYAVAATVGFMRMYNDRHWFTDVVAGAGIGVLSAHVGYWMLPVWERLFKWNKDSSKGSVTTLLPAYDCDSKSFGLSFAKSF